MNPLELLLIGVVVPGALALALMVGLTRPWRTQGAAVPGAAAIALAAGYALGFGLILGWPALPPIDVTHASPWVALLLAPLALIGGERASRWRMLGTGALGLGTGLFLLSPLYGDAPATLVALAALVALTFVVLERGLDRGLAKADPRGGALAVIVLVTGASLATLFGDVASLAQVTGALAAAVGATFVVALWRGRVVALRHAAPVVAAVVALNLWSAALYGNGRFEAIALIAVAPLVIAFVPARWLGGRVLAAIARPAALVALPVVAAALLAARAYFAEPIAADATTAPDAESERYDPDYGY